MSGNRNLPARRRLAPAAVFFSRWCVGSGHIRAAASPPGASVLDVTGTVTAAPHLAGVHWKERGYGAERRRGRRRHAGADRGTARADRTRARRPDLVRGRVRQPAWGCASADSDWDVRFVYARPEE